MAYDRLTENDGDDEPEDNDDPDSIKRRCYSDFMRAYPDMYRRILDLHYLAHCLSLSEKTTHKQRKRNFENVVHKKLDTVSYRPKCRVCVQLLI